MEKCFRFIHYIYYYLLENKSKILLLPFTISIDALKKKKKNNSKNKKKN